MFQGLHLYELILIIAGSILFLVLVGILLWCVVKKRSYKGLLVFFLLPVLMIGYPSIQSISYDNGKVQIDKNTNAVTHNPADTVAKKELLKSIEQISYSRAKNDPEALTYLAKAQFALGNYDSAQALVNTVMNSNPEYNNAITLKAEIQKQIEISNNFDEAIQQLNADLNKIYEQPDIDNSEKILHVSTILKNTDMPIYSDEEANLILAKSLATVNEKNKALEIINTILAVNPNSVQALQLKHDVENGKYTDTSDDSTQMKNIDPEKFNTVIRSKNQQ